MSDKLIKYFRNHTKVTTNITAKTRKQLGKGKKTREDFRKITNAILED